jgi:hypothetical protein
MRRAAAIVLAAVVGAAGAAPAGAYWQAGGTGGGQAPVATLGAGLQPTASAAGGTVTVQWPQTAFGGAPLGGYPAGGYAVRRHPASGGAAATPAATCDAVVAGTAATLSCQEAGVPPGAWRYTVTPVLGTWTGAESPLSAVVAVAPAAPVLTAVTAQNPSAGRPTGDVQVAWGAVAGAEGYNVYRRTTTGAYDVGAPLNGATPVTATSFADPGTGLTGWASYAYVVRAVAAGAQSASSNELTATAIGRPDPPSGVIATLRPAADVEVGWSAVAGADGYNVYRRTGTGAYDFGAPLNGATPATGTTFADASPVHGTTYRYVVRAVRAGAGGVQVESADSAETAAATADGVAPASATLADPGSPLRGSVTVSATASDAGSGIASVRVQSAPAGGSTWTDRCTATTSPYSCGLATAALADGLYDLRAIATDVAGNTLVSSVVTSRRIDNTTPSATLADPGSPLRGTVALSATGADGGSGLASLAIQRAPAGGSTWTTICTTATSPAGCSWATTAVLDGAYDLRALATDVAGNTTASVVAGRVVDNTPPVGANVQATNGSGGTAGRPEAGDVITYTFSEPLKPSSVLAGWTGTATTVTVRLTNGTPDSFSVRNAANTAPLPLGSFSTGKNYAPTTRNFTGSTMVMSAGTITVTLGAATGGVSTTSGTSTLTWVIPAGTVTDLAGNPLSAGTITESGAADLDF